MCGIVSRSVNSWIIYRAVHKSEIDRESPPAWLSRMIYFQFDSTFVYLWSHELIGRAEI